MKQLALQVEGPAFKSAIPEIADYVRIMGMNGINVSAANKSLAVNNIFADENFFHIFSFPLLYGKLLRMHVQILLFSLM